MAGEEVVRAGLEGKGAFVEEVEESWLGGVGRLDAWWQTGGL